MVTMEAEGELKNRILKAEIDNNSICAKIYAEMLIRIRKLHEEIAEEQGETIADGVISILIPKAIAVSVEEMYGEESPRILAKAIEHTMKLREMER